MATLRVLLVGNYVPDAQQSMLRFATLLREGLSAREGVEVQLLAPQPQLGGQPGRSTFSGAGKWLAYLDKYALFPRTLREQLHRFRPDVIHVTDHSNAVYVPALKRGRRIPVVVTCHDLGAVRGALGEVDATHCPASPLGKRLQRWIARGMADADHVACDTAATAADVGRLIAGPPPTSVVLLGLNYPFRKLPPDEAGGRLASTGFEVGNPFLLHVGSSLPRKNREGVIRIFARLASRWPDLRLVLAGEALSGPEQATVAEVLGEDRNRAVSVVNVDNATLESLYNLAAALVFPSRFEGFGWPVIEAQACGCPVLCSDTPALVEVAGEGAFISSADDVSGFVEQLHQLLQDPQIARTWRERAERNAERFHADCMIDSYLALYHQLLAT